MSDAIKQAMEQAKQKAAEQAPIETTQVATTGGVPTYGALTPQVATLDTLTQAGMNVDDWLKLDGHGIQIGSKKGLISSLKVRLRLQDLTAFYGVRFGDPATYYKSFDRVNCVQGGSWPEAITRAQKADPKCKGEYVGADMILTTIEDVKNSEGAILIEAGKRLGHSTSPTGSKPVAAFIREVRGKGIADDVPMIVEVKHVQREKPGVKPWGVMELTLLEVLDDDSE